MKQVYANGKFLSQKISGVQRYASQLLLHYYQQHPDVQIVAPGVSAAGYELLSQLPVKRVGNKAGLWWEQMQLPLLLQKKDAPLLLNLCNMAPVLYRNKISCIHDIAFLRYPHFFSKAFYYYYKAMIPAIIHTSRHIITVSEFSKKELMTWYRLKDDQVTVIPNAGFRNSITISEEEQLPLPRPYFLFVGSADPRKNLLFLLKAYKAACLTQTDLVIAGSGYASFNSGLLKETEQFRDDPRIHFTGHITDAQLTLLYRFAKAVVVPSVYEGFGLPVAEALSAQCEVLASDIPVFREVAGSHASYFNPYEMADLIALLQQMDALSKKNNQAGYDHIHRRYRWENSANLLSELVSAWL